MQISQRRTVFILSFVSWVLLLFRHGYSFGNGDHAEILPYMLHLNDPGLFAHDFYVNYISGITPNIRWVFVHSFRFLGEYMGIGFFILHGLYTVLLIAGTLQVARTLGMNTVKAWIGLMIYLGFGMGLIPGGNDWYMSNFQSENIAFALAIWGICFLMNEKPYVSASLFGIATFFHPLAGLLFFASTAIALVMKGKPDLKPLLLYVCTGGLYFALIYWNQGRSVAHLSPEFYFDLLVRFRNPHHNLPSAFPVLGWVISAFLIFYLFNEHGKHSPFLRNLVITIIAGSFIYIIGVQWLHLVTVAQTQWFKLYAFLWAIGSAALFNRILPDFNLNPAYLIGVLSISLFGFILLYIGPQYSPLKKPMDISGLHADPELVDICQRIKANTDTNSLFIIPFMADAFPYYSERSSYVSFKAVPHNPDGIRQWYERMREVYGVNLSSGGGFSLQRSADLYLMNSLNPNNPPKTWPGGVTHILCFRDEQVPGILMFNRKYQVIALTPK